MTYVDRVLQPGERVLRVAWLHWVVYLRGGLLLASGALVYALGTSMEHYGGLIVLAGVLLALLGVALLLGAWLRQVVTEIAVTDRRVIYKTGLVSRHTAEMNMDKVESVIVDQSVLGRVLGYGTLSVRGTGDGLENLRQIAAPLALRSAITAR